MPKYSWDIKDMLFEEDIKAIMDKTQNKRERLLISLLWITGARPMELLMLKREDFRVYSEKLEITIQTLKLRKSEKFAVEARTLSFSRPSGLNCNIYIETIIDWISNVLPGQPILTYSKRWAEMSINNLGKAAIGKTISPYHFRHSCFSWMARNGATAEQLKYFKGAKSIKSVEPYLHAVPFIVKLESMRKDRGVSGMAMGEPLVPIQKEGAGVPTTAPAPVDSSAPPAPQAPQAAPGAAQEAPPPAQESAKPTEAPTAQKKEVLI
jgi:site-specific recombinase XerD